MTSSAHSGVHTLDTRSLTSFDLAIRIGPLGERMLTLPWTVKAPVTLGLRHLFDGNHHGDPLIDGNGKEY
jgi:hypothetical protein